VTAVDLVIALLESPKHDRASALGAWQASRADGDAAGRELLDALDLLSEREQADWLACEQLWRVLCDLADRCTEANVRSRLVSHASFSASIVGELADCPYELARKAIDEDASNESAWEALAQSLTSSQPELLSDLEAWLVDRPAVARRALTVAQNVGRQEAWDEEALESLARFAARIGA
jgi:hypothetical protein